MAPPDESATIHIKNLAQVGTSNIYTMAAKPAISAKGDIYNLATGSGPTAVNFKLANSLGRFSDNPFCAYLPGEAACTTNPSALGFEVSLASNNKSFTLKIPDPAAHPDVYYRLFVVAPNGTPIIIDPRITNGGNPPFTSQNAVTPVSSEPVNLASPSAFGLVVTAFLILTLGIAFGWVLAGGRKRY